MVIETTSAKETFEAGYRLAQSVHPGQIYCLNGDLGVRAKPYLRRALPKDLGLKNRLTARPLRLYRSIMKADCRCTILMYTALPMSVKWMKSVMKNTFFQMVYA